MAERIGKDTLHFCCPGCRQVFLILFIRPEGLPENFRETPLYRACLESGIIPRSEGDLSQRKESAPPAQMHQDNRLGLDLTLRIEGMWCPACAWVIDEMLKKDRGVLDSEVFFLDKPVNIKYHSRAFY